MGTIGRVTASMRRARLALVLFMVLFLTTAASDASEPVRWSTLIAPEPPPVASSLVADDGSHLPLFVFPAAALAEGVRPPALIAIHGGGWTGSEAAILFPHCRYLAGRGLTCIAIEYRLAGQGVGLADCLADARAAVRAVVARADEFALDPTRLVLLGESAGGQLAAALAMIGDERPAIALSAVCLANPVVDIASLEWWRGIPGMAEAGDDPHAPTHPARRLSPLAHIRAGLPPMFIAHGTADVCVPYAQVERFAAALHDVGDRCDLLALPDVGHAFLLPGYGDAATQVRVLRAMDAFLVELGVIAGEATLVE